MRTVAVVGASLAGLSAARALRSQGYDGRLVLVGDEHHRPYDRPPLSKEFLAGTMGEADLALEGDDEDLRAEWMLGVRATALDRANGCVRLADGSELHADGFVLATGASARVLPGGAQPPGVHVLRSLDDARALRADLGRGGRLVVVGGGFVGAEVASTARALGLDVTLVQLEASLLEGPLGRQMGAVVSRLHADHGVRLLCGTGVQSLAGGSRVESVRLTDGRTLAADTVVVAVGSAPSAAWLAGSGLDLADGVRCTADGATNLPGVVAVGDVAACFDPALGVHHRAEHWTSAHQQPKAAVRALLSGRPWRSPESAAGAADDRPAEGAGPPPPWPYFWSDQHGARIQFVGYTALADSVTVEDGADEDGCLAVYRREGRPVAVLGINRVRQFVQWRRRHGRTDLRPTTAL